MTDVIAKTVAAAVSGVSVLNRPAKTLPIFALAAGALSISAGTKLNVAGELVDFPADCEVVLGDKVQLLAGSDYVVVLGQGNIPTVTGWLANDDPLLGGFHYAPGGNAPARQGGDTTAGINPFSIWDVGYRPACDDPRGMTRVAEIPGSEHVAPFWVDIYLLNAAPPAQGTSMFGVEIADGDRHRPKDSSGNRLPKLDYATAKSIVASHGKQLLSFAEFAAAAYGVTERQAAGAKPELTGLDAARTSRCGVMQAAGNLYVWGHDGDPDEPRASVFGGDWDTGEFAGSRCADGAYWPDYSRGWLGARGRSDHLQLDA